MQSMLVLHPDGKLFSNMTLFQTSGLEGLTHITLGIQSVLTSISLHVSTVTAFAFVGIQRTPMQRSASFAPLLSTKKLPKQQI